MQIEAKVLLSLIDLVLETMPDKEMDIFYNALEKMVKIYNEGADPTTSSICPYRDYFCIYMKADKWCEDIKVSPGNGDALCNCLLQVFKNFADTKQYMDEIQKNIEEAHDDTY